jgi:YHS domain-containing protein
MFECIHIGGCEVHRSIQDGTNKKCRGGYQDTFHNRNLLAAIIILAPWHVLSQIAINMIGRNAYGKFVSFLLASTSITGDVLMNSFNMTKFIPAGRAFETDPVCEMKVDPEQPPYKLVHQGKIYYFCSEACKILFERTPERYINATEE